MEPKKKFEGRHSELTGKILGAFFQVHKELGFGFSEKVYEGALEILLLEMGLGVARQKDIYVYYHGKVVGEYKADLIVNGVVLLELKSVDKIIDVHEAQILNYLKATEVEVGLLMNFGRDAEFRRKIYDNPRKGSLSWTKNP
ncbi:MAG: GxxExxY protein [Chloroflexi bacterium]|nr:GxxExxY protein [Chloroflexota bacterium]